MENKSKKAIFIRVVALIILVGMYYIYSNHLIYKFATIDVSSTYVNMINALLTFILVATTVTYTFFTGSLVKSEFGPKLYVCNKIVQTGGWNKSIMNDFDVNSTTDKIGFVNESSNDRWDLEVHNNGSGVATYIELSYSVIAYKYEFKFGIDEADIVDKQFVVHKKVDRKINIDYLAPGESKKFTVFYMAHFPKSDLAVNSLKCEERDFISKKVTIDSYIIDKLNYLPDMHTFRKLLNIDKA